MITNGLEDPADMGFLHGRDMPGTKWNKQHQLRPAPISHNCIVSHVCHHFTVIFVLSLHTHCSPSPLPSPNNSSGLYCPIPARPFAFSASASLESTHDSMSLPPFRQACTQLTCSATSCSVRTLQLHPSILVPWVPCTAMPNSSFTAPSCSVQLTGSSSPSCACHLSGLGALDGLGADFGPA